jgi:hypothetical protein
VWLTARGKTQFREYTGQQHYMAQDRVPLHFGLGAPTRVDTITVVWPSGIVQTLTNVSANRTITVVEPAATP